MGNIHIGNMNGNMCSHAHTIDRKSTRAHSLLEAQETEKVLAFGSHSIPRQNTYNKTKTRSVQKHHVKVEKNK